VPVLINIRSLREHCAKSSIMDSFSFSVLLFFLRMKERRTMRIFSCNLVTDNNIKKCPDVHSIKL
jgi:hypothetical protein